MSGIYWLASYPKSGNTWFRAFLHNLRSDPDRPADINELTTGVCASSRGWIDDVLGFDSADLEPDEVAELRPAVYEWTLQESEPKYAKIHDAYSFTLNGEPLVSRAATRGALYIIRNPLDVVVSAANHWNIAIDEALDRMGQEDCVIAKRRRGLRNQVHQRLSSWSGHVTSWVDAEGLRCEIVRYEDLLNDSVATFTRAARFLGIPHDSGRVQKAIRFSAFEELSRQESRAWFRERPAWAKEPFFRFGRAGAWRDTLTDAQVARVIVDHGSVMGRFGYLDRNGRPR